MQVEEKGQSWQPSSPESTVVILTPMNLEYKAVRAHLGELRQEWHSAGTAFEVGKMPGVPWPIALVVTGEGNSDAAVLAERAAALFRPWAMFVVGVAGGLKDEIGLGDVVVATWVYGYHSGKAGAAGFRARPRAYRGAHKLVQAARMVEVKGAWLESLPDGVRPAVHFKPIAAGEVVLNSRDVPLSRQLTQHYEDAAAIEMESAGATAAAYMNASLPVLTIRGISDKADGRKHLSDAAGMQPVAASHAAAFTMALLAELAGAAHRSTAQADVPRAPVATAQPGQVTSEAVPAWRSLDLALPTVWLPDLGPPRAAASAILELHLIPVEVGLPLQARRLAALADELTALGRAGKLFEPADDLLRGDPATVISAAGTGLAVTRSGQRSAWQPLPKDTIGAILDPADVASRLAAMLHLLAQIAIGEPAEAGLAVGVIPAIPVAEGRIADLPRTIRRQRTSMSAVRVPAVDALPCACLVSQSHDIAEELAARLLVAFRAQTAVRGHPR
jgi:nucleoside phosphorylase